MTTITPYQQLKLVSNSLTNRKLASNNRKFASILETDRKFASILETNREPASKPDSLSLFREYLSTRVSSGTLELYMVAIAKWIQFIEFTNKHVSNSLLNSITGQDYVNMLTKQGKSSSTIATRAHAIMRYLKWKGLPHELDCPPIRFGEPKYRSIEEILQIMSACRTLLEEVVVVVLFDTAVRISELLQLRIGDIDYKLSIITVKRKGGRQDNINISPKAMRVLKNWVSHTRRILPSDLVFDGLSYHYIRRLVKNIGERVGINDLHPHIFRHSRAIHLLNNGVPINIVSQHLGHKSIVTTINIYGRFTAIDIKDKLVGW